MLPTLLLFVFVALLPAPIVTCTPILHQAHDKRQAAVSEGAEITITGWGGINTAAGDTLRTPASVTAFVPYTGSSYSAGPNTTIYAYYEVTLTASGESTTVVETYNATSEWASISFSCND